ncbi:uncharacterized protein PV06_09489 [Exophiala oligosperma]|uniref:FAD-dependent oxidoreductase 2 FAD-binding domain-containing protein n=2 Tax=Chaetothyriales TaxID=34395 RepID=A0A0D2D5V4_9EURO|nr:uncharacterized protein PV06_09489 [Exophiala oligosperma]KAJ9637541.1 hypothetical protein H2204_004690 [Knufia peltigerae]KIW38533.1 hypothetical protein PV06_09489 [Exophiala oligosperma]
MQPLFCVPKPYGLFFRSVRPSEYSGFSIDCKRIHLARLSTTRILDVTGFDKVSDVIVVGSGAGGLTAALRAKYHGLEPLVLEKTPKIGGSSAYSGGALWVPNNHVSKAAGLEDSAEEGLRYLEAIVPPNTPSSTKERKQAYIDQSPQMVRYLEGLGFKWHAALGYPDYHCLEPGSKALGRVIEGQVFDLKKLGSWRSMIRLPGDPAPACYCDETPHIYRMGAHLYDFYKFSGMIAKMCLRMLIGQKPVTFGKSLVGQLLYLNKQHGTEIWRETGLVDLISDKDGKVIGTLVERDGKKLRIGARKGVLLAAGGFAKNSAMREQYQKRAIHAQWSVASPGDQGDAIRAGQKLGAAVDLMDSAWWMPMIIVGETPIFDLTVRSFPHAIIVDGKGSRYMNESLDYDDFGKTMNKHHETTAAIPSWIILDSRHRNNYMLARFGPRSTPKWAIENGFIYRDDTVGGLAKQINIDPTSLQTTVERFNGFALKGVDEDFNRGKNAYDNFFGDPYHKPNPNLGTIAKSPFYALRIYPGDLGTKGGLLTDEFARVLREDGNPIPGLYAAGNTTASVMGRRYAGPGATLGPAITFSYIAMDNIAQRTQD